MKTQKKPTLAQIQQVIISCLQENTLPEEKDSFKFLTLVKKWQEQKEFSVERRSTFKEIFEDFKRRSAYADYARRHNEMWAVINAILPFLEEHKSLLSKTEESKKKSRRPHFSFSPPQIDFQNLTFFNH